MGANISPKATKMAAAVVPSFPEFHLSEEKNKQTDERNGFRGSETYETPWLSSMSNHHKHCHSTLQAKL